MKSYAEALALVLDASKPLGVECVSLDHSLGRTLGEPLIAGFDLPRFDQSAVDGYAVRSTDIMPPTTLSVIGEIPAGNSASGPAVGEGESVRVFTGSPIPAGADAVVMQEEVEASADRATFAARVHPGSHIRRRAEEVRAGSSVVPSGVVATPPVIGLAATLGFEALKCAKLPRVGIVATGSELVPLGGQLGESQIFASNAAALKAAFQSVGVRDVETVTLSDDPKCIEKAITGFVQTKDIVVTCGGVSVGSYDCVRDALESAGLVKQFWKVAMKPGKPIWFGKSEGGCLAFGLPGNPVSALVGFRVFIVPALHKMHGRTTPQGVKARLESSIEKRPDLTEFVRGKLGGSDPVRTATPTSLQGSHMQVGISSADCLIVLPQGRSVFPAGETIDVLPLSWGCTA